MKKVLLVFVVFCLAASGAWAQCQESTTIGPFQVDFDGAVYNGSSTEFTYCITGLGGAGFNSLSNWMVDLDPACIASGDIVDCSTGNCYYQANDPNHGLSGIKFDSVQVGAGETVCYSFSLDGDWSGQITDTLAGLKYGPATSSGLICGPSCVNCQLQMGVDASNLAAPVLDLFLQHNRPVTVATPIRFFLYDQSGAQVSTWTEPSITLDLHDQFNLNKTIPLASPLTPGMYKLQLKMFGMSGWITRQIWFEAAP